MADIGDRGRGHPGAGHTGDHHVGVLGGLGIAVGEAAFQDVPAGGVERHWAGSLAQLDGPVLSVARGSGISTTSLTGATGDAVTPPSCRSPRTVRRRSLILLCLWSRGYTRRTLPRRPLHGISA